MHIAVLLTCHNRKAQTLQCLHSLFQAYSPQNYTMEVYLVDDGSTDGTGQAVKKQFPQVNVIEGNGSLFWAGGMRLAWKTASEAKTYDFYLWLNDDTMLDPAAIEELFFFYQEAKQSVNKENIVTGACRKSLEVHEFSYGGRNEDGPVKPNGNLQECKYINGNAVLIPHEIYKHLGNISEDYTHGMGDYDYGLRAINSGFKCFTTRTYIATCPPNEGIPAWRNPQASLKQRWDSFHSPLGLNIKEYIHFRRKFWGQKWIVFAIKSYLQVLFPRLYTHLKEQISCQHLKVYFF